jgi:hypothetical protein
VRRDRQPELFIDLGKILSALGSKYHPPNEHVKRTEARPMRRSSNPQIERCNVGEFVAKGVQIERSRAETDEAPIVAVEAASAAPIHLDRDGFDAQRIGPPRRGGQLLNEVLEVCDRPRLGEHGSFSTKVLGSVNLPAFVVSRAIFLTHHFSPNIRFDDGA